MSSISIIIPTYNRAHLITRAIDSAFDAIRAGDEIIVVDDGSTDGTNKILMKYLDRIKYVRTKNQGPGAARNYGLNIAKNPWIAFLDSDDEWVPDHLEIHRTILEKNKDILFSFSNFDVCITKHNNVKIINKYLANWCRLKSDWEDVFGSGIWYSKYCSMPEGREDFKIYDAKEIYHKLMLNSYIPAWTSVVKYNNLNAPIYFPEDIRLYEDWEFFGKLTRVGNAVYLDCSTAINHGHDGSRLTDADSLTHFNCRIKILERVWERDKEFLKEHKEEYNGIISGQKINRLKYYIKNGDRAKALIEIRHMEKCSLLYKILAHLPVIFVKYGIIIVRRIFKYNR